MKIRKFFNSRYFYITCFLALLFFAYFSIIIKTSDIFKGAFFGFIVGIVTFFFSKYYELQARRYNSLVYLEHELNACFNDLRDNRFQIKGALKTDKLTLITPIELKLTEEHIKQLGRIELKNDIFPLYVDIKKYNHSLKQAIEMFEKNIAALKDFGIKKDAQEIKMEDTIQAYYGQYKNNLKNIWEFGEKLSECIKKCMVEIRFFAKNDQPLLSKRWMLPYYDKKDYDKWLKDDLNRLENEMSASTRKDEQERQQIREKAQAKEPR